MNQMNLFEPRKSRADTVADKILDLLKSAGRRGVDNFELAQVTPRYGARIFELRREGYNITKTKISLSKFKYYLEDGKEYEDTH